MHDNQSARLGNGKGWVRLCRDVMDSPRFKDGDWLKVKIFLAFSATHGGGGVRRAVFDGKCQTLRPGELVVSRNQIAEATGVNPSKVQRVLKQMQDDGEIDQLSSPANRLITLLPGYGLKIEQPPSPANADEYKAAGRQRQKVNSERTASRENEQPPLAGNADEYKAAGRVGGATEQLCSNSECLPVSSAGEEKEKTLHITNGDACSSREEEAEEEEEQVQYSSSILDYSSGHQEIINTYNDVCGNAGLHFLRVNAHTETLEIRIERSLLQFNYGDFRPLFRWAIERVRSGEEPKAWRNKTLFRVLQNADDDGIGGDELEKFRDGTEDEDGSDIPF